MHAHWYETIETAYSNFKVQEHVKAEKGMDIILCEILHFNIHGSVAQFHTSKINGVPSPVTYQFQLQLSVPT